MSSGQRSRAGGGVTSCDMDDGDEVCSVAGVAGVDGLRSKWSAWVRRRLPIVRWAPRYDRTAAVADLIAGLTLGLTLVPQSIAYAALANLPVHYGLYSAYMGTILYVFLGTVKEVSIGPTSLMALLTLQLCRGLPIEFVVLLTFLSGVIVLLMGLLRLGFLTEVISPAVTSGFTSATALTIVVSQVKGVLGLSFVAESVADNLRLVAQHWRDLRRADAALAASCCALLLLLRKAKDIKLSEKRVRVRRALWVLSIGRNALVVVGAATLAYCLHRPGEPVFLLSGRVQAGVPRVALPPTSVRVGNATLGFGDMVRTLGPGLAMVPLVMVVANVAIAKAFSGGRRVDATQEMVTLGLANVAGALVHAMPVCGAFTRSAVSHASGVRTPAAGLYAGGVALLALCFLTPYFYYIPKACLSSVLICAVVFMVDTATVRRLWAAREAGELGALALTAGVALGAGVEAGVLAGALAAAGATLVRLAAARLEPAPAAVLRPALPLLYLNCEAAARALLAAAARAPRRPLLLDAAHVCLLDYTATRMLERVAKKLKESDRTLIIFNAPAAILPRLETIEGLEKRALTAPTAERALQLAAPPDKPPSPAAPLLPAPVAPVAPVASDPPDV